MISSDVPATPRPRPPAQLRRSSSLQARPKPRFALDVGRTAVEHSSPADSSEATIFSPGDPTVPVLNTLLKDSLLPTAPSLPMLLGSPITVTSHILRQHGRTLRPLPEVQEWYYEKSREELEELVQKAEELIKERESEFDISSAVRKSLCDTSTELRTKNDALLSCIPSSVSHPGSPSRTPSHSRTSSFDALPQAWSPKIPRAPLAHSTGADGAVWRQHSRRISSTPAELAFLSDQNAELHSRLQDLEADAARADNAGRRRLRLLEREIQGLKEELDATRRGWEHEAEESPSRGRRATGESIPRDAVGMGVGVAEAVDADADNDNDAAGAFSPESVKMLRRFAREAKVAELKARTRPWDQHPPAPPPSAEEGVKDFAPRASTTLAQWPSTPGRRRTLYSSLSKAATTYAVAEPMLESEIEPRTRVSDRYSGTGDAEDIEDAPSHPFSHFPTPPHSPVGLGVALPARERAVVAALLAKVRELEETNIVLADQHREARERLRDAEGEAKEMRKRLEAVVLEGDGEGEEVVIAEEETEEGDGGDGEVEIAFEMVDDGKGGEQGGLEKGAMLMVSLSGDAVSPRRTLRFRSAGSRSIRSVRSFGELLGANAEADPFGDGVSHHSSLRTRRPSDSALSLFMAGPVASSSSGIDGRDSSALASDGTGADAEESFFSRPTSSRGSRRRSRGSGRKERKSVRGLFEEDLLTIAASPVVPNADERNAAFVFPSRNHDDDGHADHAQLELDPAPASPHPDEGAAALSPTATSTPLHVHDLRINIPSASSPSLGTPLDTPAFAATYRTLGDELPGGALLSPASASGTPFGMRSAPSLMHMRSKSIAELLCSAEADSAPSSPAGGAFTLQAVEGSLVVPQMPSPAGGLFGTEPTPTRKRFASRSAAEPVGRDEPSPAAERAMRRAARSMALREDELVADTADADAFRTRYRRAPSPLSFANTSACPTTSSGSITPTPRAPGLTPHSPRASGRYPPLFSLDDFSSRFGRRGSSSGSGSGRTSSPRHTPRPGEEKARKEKRQGSIAYLLMQLWAWTQVWLMITMLLGTAARFGPKSVLGGTRRR